MYLEASLHRCDDALDVCVSGTSHSPKTRLHSSRLAIRLFVRPGEGSICRQDHRRFSPLPTPCYAYNITHPKPTGTSSSHIPALNINRASNSRFEIPERFIGQSPCPGFDGQSCPADVSGIEGGVAVAAAAAAAPRLACIFSCLCVDASAGYPSGTRHLKGACIPCGHSNVRSSCHMPGTQRDAHHSDSSRDLS